MKNYPIHTCATDFYNVHLDMSCIFWQLPYHEAVVISIFLGIAAWGLIVLLLVLALRLRRAMFSICTGKEIAHSFEVSTWWRNVISEIVKQNAGVDLSNVKIYLVWNWGIFLYMYWCYRFTMGKKKGRASF